MQRHLQNLSLMLDTEINFTNYRFSLYEGVGEAANVWKEGTGIERGKVSETS